MAPQGVPIYTSSTVDLVVDPILHGVADSALEAAAAAFARPVNRWIDRNGPGTVWAACDSAGAIRAYVVATPWLWGWFCRGFRRLEAAVADGGQPAARVEDLWARLCKLGTALMVVSGVPLEVLVEAEALTTDGPGDPATDAWRFPRWRASEGSPEASAAGSSPRSAGGPGAAVGRGSVFGSTSLAGADTETAPNEQNPSYEKPKSGELFRTLTKPSKQQPKPARDVQILNNARGQNVSSQTCYESASLFSGGDS